MGSTYGREVSTVSAWGGFARAYLDLRIIEDTDSYIAYSYVGALQMYNYEGVPNQSISVTGWGGKTDDYAVGNYPGGGTWYTSSNFYYSSGRKIVYKEKAPKNITITVTCSSNGGWFTDYQGISRYINAYTTSTSQTISVPAKTSYRLSYDANGGVGAPEAQTKWYGEDLTLSQSIPTRSPSVTSGYSITYNGGEGTPDIYEASSRRTINYSFHRWTDSDGEQYISGGTYSKNKATTMTASWSTSYVNGSVILPGALRTGYDFNGWYTSSSGGTRIGGAGDTYTPSEDVTVYAQWTAQFSTIDSVTPLVYADSGSAVIKWTPKVSTFSYVVEMSINGNTYTSDRINPDSTYQYSYSAQAIPSTAIPNAESGTVSVTLYTYINSSSSQSIGSNTSQFNLVIPSNVVPSIVGIPVVEQGRYSSPQSLGGNFVQTMSNIKSTTIAQGASGSSITSIVMKVSQSIVLLETSIAELSTSGVRTTGVAETISQINYAGNIKVTITVTDSRNRTASYEKTIVVYQYATPTGAVSIDTQNNEITGTGYISSVNALNPALVYWVRHKVSDGDDTTNDVRNPSSGYLNLRSTTPPSYSDATGYFTTVWSDTVDLSTDTYRYTLFISDSHTNIEEYAISAIVCISRFAGGKGVRLFGEAYQDGFMVGDIDMTITNSEAETLNAWLGGS